MLRYGSFVFKPIFAANHRWAMAKGEESLRLELERRHTRTPEELARIPAPPGPTFATAPDLLAGMISGAALAVVARHLFRRS